MRKIFSLIVLVGIPQFGFADFVYSKCEKWSDEGWSHFDCSNEKSYVVGNAICSTTDSRLNGDKNLTHGPRPQEIFCRFKLKDDLTRCLNDSESEVEACYKEYKRTKSNTTKSKSNPWPGAK